MCYLRFLIFHNLRRPCVLSSTRFIGDDEFDERMNLLSPVPQEGSLPMYFPHTSPYTVLTSPIGRYSSPMPTQEQSKNLSGGSSTKDGIVNLRDPVGARFTV
ncbi:unnamed protein product, partial [Nesidiocoris tenuis]